MSRTLVFSNTPRRGRIDKAILLRFVELSCFPLLVLEAEVAYADPDAFDDDVQEPVVVRTQVVNLELGLRVGSTEGRLVGVLEIAPVAGHRVCEGAHHFIRDGGYAHKVEVHAELVLCACVHCSGVRETAEEKVRVKRPGRAAVRATSLYYCVLPASFIDMTIVLSYTLYQLKKLTQ